DGRVGGVGVIRPQRLAHHRGRCDPPEGVVGITEMLKPVALLGRVGRGPARAGTEGVEVLVHREVAQRVRGAVQVADAHAPAQDARGLVEGGRDVVGYLLLPIAGRIGASNEKKDSKHRDRESRVFRTPLARKGGRCAGPPVPTWAFTFAGGVPCLVASPWRRSSLPPRPPRPPPPVSTALR